MPNKTSAATSLLVEKVRQEVQERRGQYSEIGRRTGIPESWIRAFSQGRIGDPGFTRLEVLAAGVGYRITLKVMPAVRATSPVDRDAALRRALENQVYGRPLVEEVT